MNNGIAITIIIITIVAVSTSSYFYFTSSLYKQQSLDARNSEKIFPSVPEGFTVYINNIMGFTVHYPQEWTVQYSKIQPENVLPNTMIEFSPVTDSDIDNYGKPVFRVFTLSIPEDQSLTDFITDRNTAAEKSNFIDEIEYTLSNGHIFNKEAIVMELEQKTFGDKFQELSYFVKSNNVVYVIVYVSLASEYESEIDVAKEMFSSFRLLSP